MSETTSESEFVEKRIAGFEDRLDHLRNNPNKAVSERVGELESHLEKVEPRETTHSDFRCVHDHLTLVKKGIERDPDAYIQHRVKSLEARIDEKESLLEDM